MALISGTKLGPYEVLSAAGAGRMGEVHRARDTRLDRTVAIKVLPSGVAAQTDLRQRFEREARAISALNHPNICTLYDIGHQDGTDYLVMEYLERNASREGQFPRSRYSSLPARIADALERAHRNCGLAHNRVTVCCAAG